MVPFFNQTRLLKDIHFVSLQHMKMGSLENTYAKLHEKGCSKLQPLIPQDASGSNIRPTLDHILNNGSQPPESNELVLIAGSFFIMTDVRRYLGVAEKL